MIVILEILFYFNAFEPDFKVYEYNLIQSSV